MQKPSHERKEKDYEDVHAYMTEHIKFFQTRKESDYNKNVTKSSVPVMTYNDKMEMYKVMLYRVHKQGKNLTELGKFGDRFFIILEGLVGVRVPTVHEGSYNSTWDVFKFVLREMPYIRQAKDTTSRECLSIINVVGRDVLLKHNFNRVTKFVEYLKELESADSELFDDHQELNRDLIEREYKKIRTFRERLMSEYSRIGDTPGGSASKP